MPPLDSTKESAFHVREISQVSTHGRASTTHRTVSQFVALLKQCSDLERGKALHSDAVSCLCHTNKYVAAALIKMYGKCGSMIDARDVFDTLSARDVVTWNSLVLGYVENGESTVALDLFRSMDCRPSSITFVAALKACTLLAAGTELVKEFVLETGMGIHKQARELGFHSNVVVATTLVDMYSKCGNMLFARTVFASMPLRNVVSWNCLILGYVDNGESLVALDLFRRMECEPDSVTFVGALKACTCLSMEGPLGNRFPWMKGVEIHKQVTDRRLDSSTAVSNTLLDMYRKLGSMRDARQVFDKMPRRDVVSWNCILLGYVENGPELEAVELFIRSDCLPSSVTSVAVVKACASLAAEEKLEKRLCMQRAREVHEQLKRHGLDSDIPVANTLIDMFSKCGCVRSARDVFERMPRRDVVSWSALILGYVENKQSAVAMDLFERIDCEPNHVTLVAGLKACASLAAERSSEKQHWLERGVAIHQQVKERELQSNVVVENMLLHMYCKCGDMVRARRIFDGMQLRNVVAWTSLILGYVENGETRVALELLVSMDCEADSAAFAAALKACGSLAVLPVGRRTHAKLCRLGMEQVQTVATSLVDFYAKCGIMETAHRVFYCMASPDIVSWTALIAGYSSLGDTSQMFGLLERMQETSTKPDEVTLLCMLSACSHSGKVEEGRSCFNAMERLGVRKKVEHYNCMVDMLGRANRLHEALSITVSGMQLESNTVTWTTLLAACKEWKNVEVGKIAFDALVNVEKDKKWNI